MLYSRHLNLISVGVSKDYDKLGRSIDTVQAEKEYRWLEAATSYAQGLNPQTCKASDSETWERIGYCYSLASRQTNSPEEFAKLRKLAVEAYEKAAELYSSEPAPESDGKNAMCLALSQYTASWFSPNSSEKQKTLRRCHSLGQDAAEAFKKTGNKLDFAKTCLILSQCLLDLVLITMKAEEKTGVVQEGLQFASEAISILSNHEKTR